MGKLRILQLLYLLYYIFIMMLHSCGSIQFNRAMYKITNLGFITKFIIFCNDFIIMNHSTNKFRKLKIFF